MKIQYFSADSSQNGKAASCLQFTDEKSLCGKHGGTRRRRAGARGSLTIEAALVLPLAVLTLAGFLTFFSFLVTELKVQAAIDRVAENLAAAWYGVEKAADTELGQQVAELTELPVASGVVSAITVKALATGEMEGTVGDGIVAGGIAGILFQGSGYDEDTKRVTVRASYGLKIPFLPFSGLLLPVTQTAVRRAYVGEALEEAEEEAEAYVAENGKVYHTSLSCTYLKLSIREVSRAEVPFLRNTGGGKYYACELCGEGRGDKVFITDYGDRFHDLKNCAGLKRGIKSMPLADAAEKYPMCSRCRARERSG